MPILVGSLWLTRRGKLIGLLCLPGASFYVLYNYTAYLFAIPISTMSIVYLALVMLSAYVMIRVIVSMDANAIQRRLGGAVPARLGGGVLIGFGILFLFRAIGVILDPSTLPTEFAVAVADLVITPAWIIGGVMLWRRNAWGYVVGLGLLFQASLSFIGLCLFLLLQPFLTTAPFVLTDIVVIFVMGFACFIPFGLYGRGVTSRETKGVY